jgi:hypothetical protein
MGEVDNVENANGNGSEWKTKEDDEARQVHGPASAAASGDPEHERDHAEHE